MKLLVFSDIRSDAGTFGRVMPIEADCYLRSGDVVNFSIASVDSPRRSSGVLTPEGRGAFRIWDEIKGEPVAQDYLFSLLVKDRSQDVGNSGCFQ